MAPFNPFGKTTGTILLVIGDASDSNHYPRGRKLADKIVPWTN